MNKNPTVSATVAPAIVPGNSQGGNWPESCFAIEPVLPRALAPHLFPLLPDPPDRPGMTRAAVLIALAPFGNGWGVLLAKRALSVAAHPGQISFPGGKREPHDRDDTVCALRESQEETGLSPDGVHLLGRLPPRATRSTGFWIQPVVGWLSQWPEFSPDPREVAEIFVLPLSALSACVHDMANDETHLPTEHGVIWGATASLLLALHMRLERLSL